MFFQIPPFIYRWIVLHDISVTRAVASMIADDAAGLQVGIDGDSSEKFEAAFLQVLADPV